MTAQPVLKSSNSMGDMLAAVGGIILGHASLIESLFLFFHQYLKLPGDTTVMLFDTLNNRDRVDLIKRLVAASDPKPGDVDAIVHVLRCADICTENRNIIAHCSHIKTDTDGYHFHKGPTGVSRTSWDLVVPLEALQQCAGEMQYISGNIMLLWHHLVDRGTPDEIPWPTTPLQPRKLSLFRLPKDRGGDQPPPRS